MSDSSNKQKRASVVAVFWIVLALVLLIVFLVNQDKIVRVLKDTNFFVHVFGEQPEFLENYELPEIDDTDEGNILLSERDTVTENTNTETITLADSVQPLVNPDAVSEVEKETLQENVSVVEKPVISTAPVEKPQETSTVTQPVTSTQQLYFVFVNGDGTVERKEITRTVPKSTTPLTASLQALLAGPSAGDKSNGYMSFIPAGTKLLSVSIQDGTALINLSEEFSFNQYGVDGYLAQLMQVVYTATSFSTIKNVRFFIEGEQSSYLGNDGVWIGSPLSRTDFK